MAVKLDSGNFMQMTRDKGGEVSESCKEEKKASPSESRGTSEALKSGAGKLRHQRGHRFQ